MAKNSLIIITNAFPFTLKESFIGMELPFHLKRFEKVILIPLNIEKEYTSISSNIEVLDEFGIKNSNKTLFSRLKKGFISLFSSHLWKDVYYNFKHLKNIKAMWSLVGNVGTSQQLSKYLDQLIKQRPELNNVIFYSYWLHIHATALALLKQKRPSITIVSRAHAYDIYEKEHFPFFIPLRKFTLKSLDKIYPISDHGKEHLLHQHPEIKNKLLVSRLGVNPHHIKCPIKVKNQFSFVSCSFLTAIKQVDLIIEAIALVAKRNPKINFKWDHLGGGTLFSELNTLATEVFPANVFWKIHGNLSSNSVIDFYRENYVDLFLSASKIEGIPVSMMEALAFGIPILGTDVGGVSELIHSKNGVLLKKVTSEIIAIKIDNLLTENKLNKMRIQSYLTWKEKFNNSTNFELFTHDLKSSLSM